MANPLALQCMGSSHCVQATALTAYMTSLHARVTGVGAGQSHKAFAVMTGSMQGGREGGRGPESKLQV